MLARIILIVMAMFASPSVVAANEFCQNLRGIVRASGEEFSSLRGEALDSPVPSLKIYLGSRILTKDGTCAIAEQTDQGTRFSTSYTCSNASADSTSGLKALTDQVQECLGVETWTEQANGARAAKYGLLSLTMTRNGANGLALGVEVFRDEQGRVMGSPLRGDRAEANGGRRCNSRSLEDLERLFAGYGARPGARKFERPDFFGFLNEAPHPIVVFLTRPIHPAHPALIVRDVETRDGQTVLHAKGDFAGDCEEFHKLLGQVVEMNREAGARAQTQ